MKKNIVKPIAYSIIGVGITSLIIGTCIDWSHTPLLFASGSSSVQSLIQTFGNTFTNADVIANVGGSGMGISEIAMGLKDFGMASKMPSPSLIGVDQPVEQRFTNALNDGKISSEKIDSSLYTTKDNTREYYLKNETNTDLWGGIKTNNNNKTSAVKTVTIAWDAIAIVYSRKNLPDNVKLNINNNNIGDIFAAFSGYKKFDLVDIINKGTPGSIVDNSLKIPLKPFVRSGGANASGTADAFYKDSHLEPNMNGWSDDEIANYKNCIDMSLGKGSYGKFVETTNESNSQAWNTVLGGNQNQYAGKIVYLSSGYVSQNLKEILSKGFDVALYNGHDLIKDRNTSNPSLDSEMISKEYGWYRPFNIMLNIPKNEAIKEPLVNFINYLLRESQDGIGDEKNTPIFKNDMTADGINTFLNEGYSPLSKEQIMSMMLPNSSNNYTNIWNFGNESPQKIFDDFLKEFYISDFDLLEKMDDERFATRIENGILYGANPNSIEHKQIIKVGTK